MRPQILEQRGDSGKQWHRLAQGQAAVDIGSGHAGVVEPPDDHGVQRFVECLDPLDGRFDEVGRRHFAGGNQRGLVGGVEPAGGLRDR